VSESTPKVTAVAISAIASGSSRIGGPKTSIRTMAITRTEAPSRRKISPRNSPASSSRTTGTPLTL
jgi:hypothetical protein